jgi:hypothetical protein
MQGHRKVYVHLGCPPIIDWANADVNMFRSGALPKDKLRNPERHGRYTLIARFDYLQ